MVNPLTSLNYPFCVPTLIITTWRGQPGVNDEPQHEQMGRIMHQLLDTIEIPWVPFPMTEAEIPGVMEQAEHSMAERQRPFALVMSKDTVAPHKLTGRTEIAAVKATTRSCKPAPRAERLTRTEAIRLIVEGLTGREAVIATTGMTGRELFTVADRPNHLYVVGGMGTASAIGFGIAHALPEQPVVVLDGDGAALMKLGSFATIGYYQPKNLLHVILDNETHDSTGGQHTSSPISRFAEIAAATNYKNAFSADRAEDLRACLQHLRGTPGPSLLHVKIQPGSPDKIGRPTVKPREVKERFMDFLHTNQSIPTAGSAGALR
jgi:phosphonopyruvate decarboxylase